MKPWVHATAGVLAMALIFLFLTSTLVSEMVGSQPMIRQVKEWIVMPGLVILIPAMMVLGATGVYLSRSRKGSIVAAKKRRMPVIVLNGLLILLPCALVLNHWAAQGLFGPGFYVVQALEILAGIVNLGLLGLSFCDGLRLAGRRSPARRFEATG